MSLARPSSAARVSALLAQAARLTDDEQRRLVRALMASRRLARRLGTAPRLRVLEGDGKGCAS